MSTPSSWLKLQKTKEGETGMRRIFGRTNQERRTGKGGDRHRFDTGLERHAAKWHGCDNKWKKQAREEQERTQQRLFDMKGKGKCANPLIAAIRPVGGKDGQPKRSVAAAPQEVDEIVRNEYEGSMTATSKNKRRWSSRTAKNPKGSSSKHQR